MYVTVYGYTVTYRWGALPYIALYMAQKTTVYVYMAPYMAHISNMHVQMSPYTVKHMAPYKVPCMAPSQSKGDVYA